MTEAISLYFSLPIIVKYMNYETIYKSAGHIYSTFQRGSEHTCECLITDWVCVRGSAFQVAILVQSWKSWKLMKS